MRTTGSVEHRLTLLSKVRNKAVHLLVSTEPTPAIICHVCQLDDRELSFIRRQTDAKRLAGASLSSARLTPLFD